ncbi:Two-component sensor CbrA: intrcellular carbon:nitrogen balance [Thioalkalivibrio nitratireducens DSM 14787]|uniref:histidine kinase n=1 Tax=Thioalkalivibrio nitratireducens (strain DSM 14787 / UNIQEM 213 / ALEN2) TaxID=1255043 RepID=L0E0I9_THIND|nr:ATP-binding protein [Thioalkalivibrio nitratireducens]AGA34730.1 Two-component sensor CbrA: intrcellular carbon:nitrogen balance [Thioalkalivibrio nitratireducens DSM 14787]
MTLSLGLLYTVGVFYLALLFGIAFVAERSRTFGRIAGNPWVYTLSLGVYATSWTFYGNLGFLEDHGYLYLTIYLGVTLAFAATPWLLRPILQLAREHQLTSLADLFAFRYRSTLTGPLVALFMLTGILPYIALQIKAVAESAAVLTADTPPHLLALTFSATIALFAILFGARHISPREKHSGLVIAIAFESLVKLLALLIVAAIALYAVFGGLSGLDAWLDRHPEAVSALYEPVTGGGWYSLMVLAFAAAFLLPRQFHMLFTENINPQALNRAAWGFPLFLLLLNLPMPVLYWAGQAAGLTDNPNYYALGLAGWLESPALALLVFIGGVSAASAMMIVTTLALANMGMNYLSLPARLRERQSLPANLYRNLLWGRRIWIVLIIALGYGFYGLLQVVEGLAQLGLISFAAVTQFLPGLIGLMLWPRATRVGFLLGLVAGITGWFFALVAPLLANAGIWASAPRLQHAMGADGLDVWTFALTLSVGTNALLFVLGSMWSRPNQQEIEAGQACCPREPFYTSVDLPLARDVPEMEAELAATLGTMPARHEIERALDDLGLPRHTRSRRDLQRLRERIERNLSGLLGPVLARMIVDRHLRLDAAGRSSLSESLRRIEQQLEDARLPLTGLAAELDALRRFHRQILHELPLGVCSVTAGGEITGWNHALTQLTGVPTENAVGQVVERLERPWGGLLQAFLDSDDRQLYKLNLETRHGPRRLNLHKSSLELASGRREGHVILIEDVTARVQLENEVAHSDRLASIGRFAAGVAHEIGNPLAGIASLAQTLPLEDDPDEIRDIADDIIDQTRRINAIVQSLIAFAHSDTPPRSRFEPVDLDDVISEAIRLTRLAGRKDLHYAPVGIQGLSVEGARAKLLQVFINLLTNAEQASPPGATIRIRAQETGARVRVDIMDQGPGIEPSALDRLFEPFFTTKPAGQGTGLGLPVAYSIVQDHGGSLMAANAPEGGAMMILTLPLGRKA